MSQKLNNFSIYFFIYLFFIFLCAVFYLYQKHSIGNDSTISEWLINYQGGFTRRGLIGEISFQIADYLNLSLRFVIFIFQSLLYFIYSILIYLYIKKLPKNILTIIAIFSPILFLYPIAEIEVLARKEIFLYIGFIIFLNLSTNKFSKNAQLLYVFIIFPILCLIWEPFIFFYFFVIFIILINNNNDSFKKISLKIFLSFSSSILTALYIIMNIMTVEDHQLMKDALMNNFGEACYMSCALMGSKSSINAQFVSVSSLLSAKIFFRYSLIIIIGFLPLFILLYNSKLKEKNIFFDSSKNLLIPFLILLSSTLLLFASMTDWGRVVNMSYTFALLTYLYLLKNDLIIVDKKVFFFDNCYQNRKKLFIFLFILFAFSWNQKTSMRADIASNSLYKIIYNTSKKIFKYDGIRLFQNSNIIKFHQKYIE